MATMKDSSSTKKHEMKNRQYTSDSTNNSFEGSVTLTSKLISFLENKLFKNEL